MWGNNKTKSRNRVSFIFLHTFENKMYTYLISACVSMLSCSLSFNEFYYYYNLK